MYSKQFRSPEIKNSAPYFFFYSLRRMSGQNSLTTMVIVSYPT
jgi:hypothetical protein